MSTLYIAGLTFVSVSMCVVGVLMLVFEFWFRDQNRIRERLQQAFSDEMQERAKSSPLFKDE